MFRTSNYRRSSVEAAYSISFELELFHPEQILYRCSRSVVHSAQSTLNIYTGFILSQLMTNTSGCCYSL